MGWFLHVLLRSAEAPGVESTSQERARTEWRQGRKCIESWSWTRLGKPANVRASVHSAQVRPIQLWLHRAATAKPLLPGCPPHGRMEAGRAKADALPLASRSARRRERQSRMAGPGAAGAGERGCRKAGDVIDNFPTTAFGRFANEKS
jgi:hypothetical protein